jgi:hypothetical protein
LEFTFTTDHPVALLENSARPQAVALLSNDPSFKTQLDGVEHQTDASEEDATEGGEEEAEAKLVEVTKRLKSIIVTRIRRESRRRCGRYGRWSHLN